MKFVLVILFLMFLVSCNSQSIDDYNDDAKATCICMDTKMKAVSEENGQNKTSLFYVLCAQEIEEKYKLNFQDNEFEEALGQQCPQMLKLHLKLTESSIDF